jgi:DNA-binding transcriptional LysR family regulator
MQHTASDALLTRNDDHRSLANIGGVRQRTGSMRPWGRTSHGSLRPHQRAPSINLAAVDLNLLVALEALLSRCNVTHAAQSVGLSQPAMSRALSRLRGMFSDDLLVRASSGLVRTPRAEELYDKVSPALEGVRKLFACRNCAPGEWRSVIRIAIPDHQAFVLLAPLLTEPDVGESRLQIVTEPLGTGTLKRLESEEIQFAVGQLGDVPACLSQCPLYTDRYACLVRVDHPALAQDWTPETYYAYRHATGASGSKSDVDEVHDPLARVLPNRDRVIIPSTMSAPMVVAETDLILTVPCRVAAKMAAMLPLAILDMPVDVPCYEVSLFWCDHRLASAEHAWLLSKLAAAGHAGSPGNAAC